MRLTGLTPDVCTVSEETDGRDANGRATATASVTLVGAGECLISGDQAGDDRYRESVRTYSLITVNKATQAITFPSISDVTIGTAPFDVTVSGGSSPERSRLDSKTPAVCTLGDQTPGTSSGPTVRTTATATVSVVGTGTCTLEAEQAGDDDFMAADAAQASFEVSRGTQSIAFASLESRTYGAPSLALAATGGASTAAVTLTSTTPLVCTVSGVVPGRSMGLARTTASVDVVGAGACVITAAQEGTADYSAADDVVRSFMVGRAPLTITAQDTTMALGGTVPALSATYSGLVNGEGPDVVTGQTCSTTATSRSPVGSYPVNCAGGVAANYAITYRPGRITVGYSFHGFIGLAASTANTVKVNSTVSLAWTLQDAAGSFLTSKSTFGSVTVAPMTCGGAVPSAGTVVGAGVRDLRVTSGGTFTYSWRTPKKATGCFAATLNLADTSSHPVLFKYKRHKQAGLTVCPRPVVRHVIRCPQP